MAFKQDRQKQNQPKAKTAPVTLQCVQNKWFLPQEDANTFLLIPANHLGLFYMLLYLDQPLLDFLGHLRTQRLLRSSVALSNITFKTKDLSWDASSCSFACHWKYPSPKLAVKSSPSHSLYSVLVTPLTPDISSPETSVWMLSDLAYGQL